MDEPTKARRNLMAFATAILVISLLDVKTLSFSGAVLQLVDHATRIWVLSIIVLIYLCLRFWVSEASRHDRSESKKHALQVRDQIVTDRLTKNPEVASGKSLPCKYEPYPWPDDIDSDNPLIRHRWTWKIVDSQGPTQTHLKALFAENYSEPIHEYYVAVLENPPAPPNHTDARRQIVKYKVTITRTGVCMLWISALLRDPRIKWDILENNLPMVIGLGAIGAAICNILPK